MSCGRARDRDLLLQQLRKSDQTPFFPFTFLSVSGSTFHSLYPLLTLKIALSLHPQPAGPQIQAMSFSALFSQLGAQPVVILDGGMGTTLQAPPFELSLDSALWS